MCSQQYFTSTLCVHNNILVPHYVFTTIFYFYTMCSQQYFTSTLCVHNNILLEHSLQPIYKIYGSIRSIHVSRLTKYMVVYGASMSADLQGTW
jgi:hypothetical protein